MTHAVKASTDSSGSGAAIDSVMVRLVVERFAEPLDYRGDGDACKERGEKLSESPKGFILSARSAAHRRSSDAASDWQNRGGIGSILVQTHLADFRWVFLIRGVESRTPELDAQVGGGSV